VKKRRKRQAVADQNADCRKRKRCQGIDYDMLLRKERRNHDAERDRCRNRCDGERQAGRCADKV
jgi:hypothetical protein